MPDGHWRSIPEYTGEYTSEQAEVYSRCLANAVRSVRRPASRVETELRSLLEGGDPRQGRRACLPVAGAPRGSAAAASPPGMRMLPGAVPVPVDGIGGVEPIPGTEPEETPAARRKREDLLRQDSEKASALWEARADRKEWSHVKVDLEVYRHAGQDVKEDPRGSEDYRGRGLSTDLDLEMLKPDTRSCQKRISRRPKKCS